jgi:hypothetical protein
LPVRGADERGSQHAASMLGQALGLRSSERFEVGRQRVAVDGQHSRRRAIGAK